MPSPRKFLTHFSKRRCCFHHGLKEISSGIATERSVDVRVERVLEDHWID
uniref:Uncharacterized protein n=1 Tax=Nelumbo nucifera TaxID=4432 RepID=A0A822YEI0_NELNU|nr:TPA_asm: hypothetical protein HUJ06_029376 [Nelumbo nucifera]